MLKPLHIAAIVATALSAALLSRQEQWGAGEALLLAGAAILWALAWSRVRRLPAGPGPADGQPHYLVDTACFLDWDSLSRDFDPETALLIKAKINSGCRDGAALKPGLEKAVSRLKKMAAARPEDAGPRAYLGWALGLLSRIAGREAARGIGGEIPEINLWNKALSQYRLAAELAPAEIRATVALDLGRILEERGALLSARDEDPSPLFETALKQYERAAEFDPDLKPAWRGRGRLKARLVMELDREPAVELLSQAVELYEQARGEGLWDWDFYEEFGQAAYALAQFHPERAAHYFRYASNLFSLAAEKNSNDASLGFQAGRALHQAGYALEELDPAQAEVFFRESLNHFRRTVRRFPDDAQALLWAARNLVSIEELTAAGDEQAERDGRSRAETAALLDEAAEFCARSAAISPTEEIYSEWANILSLKAERGGPHSAELWAATARKYAKALAFEDGLDERAAVNWHNWAYALSALAESRPAAEGRLKLLAQAAAKYEKAAGMNGDNVVTLKNWGDVLSDMAELAVDPDEASRLTAEAEAIFRKAARLYPAQGGPWRRWSLSLQRQARTESIPARRRELWQAALEKLERGVQAEPEAPDTWIIWGQALSELYWEAAEYERPILISGIVEKYEKALSLDEKDAEIWALLGRARLEASEVPAELSTCGDEVENATAAVEAFKKACALAGGEAGRWADWGRALFRLSQLIDNEASALSALMEAGEKYHTAVALEPDNGEHHTGLGHILYQWGWHLEDTEERRAKFKQAYECCAEAGRLAPYDPVVWRNWGKVTEALALQEKDPAKSYDWQSEAEEKFYQADIIDSGPSRDRRH